jgi:hypothetical protein
MVTEIGAYGEMGTEMGLTLLWGRPDRIDMHRQLP